MGLKSSLSFSDIEPNITRLEASMGKIKSAFQEYASMSDTPDEIASAATGPELAAAYNNLVRLWKKQQQRLRRAAQQMS